MVLLVVAPCSDLGRLGCDKVTGALHCEGYSCAAVADCSTYLFSSLEVLVKVWHVYHTHLELFIGICLLDPATPFLTHPRASACRMITLAAVRSRRHWAHCAWGVAQQHDGGTGGLRGMWTQQLLAPSSLDRRSRPLTLQLDVQGRLTQHVGQHVGSMVG